MWPLFPQCPAYGFTSMPDYSVSIVERGSGIRTVNRNWYYPLHVYSAVPIGEKFEDDIHRVLRFWHAIGGQSGRFLLIDYVDYKSTEYLDDAITASDQPLVVNPDSPTTWQLVKVYRDPEFLLEQQRLIQKPQPDTVLIAADGVELEEGVDYTLNYDTGIATFAVEPSGVMTWGGRFYVPVMFETKPEFVISNKRIQQTEFALRELRLEVA